MPGVKHLIECHCVLKIYKKNEKIQYHKFPVYSRIEENKVIPKIVKCNNCESVHYVFDICKSELRPNKDQTSVTLDIEDISLSLNDKICKVLDKYKCDISTYEHVQDIIEESRWGENVVLKRDIIGDNENVKILTIHSEDSIKIQNKTLNPTVLGVSNE